ncbi:MAG TPA: hypothetical protein VM198_12130 [Longimicrobiales bacterium]|nr:hypothetical protein [Longimicrobiales bacterium]
MIRPFALAILVAVPTACRAPQSAPASPSEPHHWLAGDHHIHSRYSVGWDDSVDPPSPIIAGDAIYPIPMNARMARSYGLAWMVTTDHGGPNHSKVSLELSYPELLESRRVVPGLIQFFGLEFDPPGAEHASLIVPHGHDEVTRLHDIESRFARREAWPADTARNRPPLMLEALRAMRAQTPRPIVMVNHPSRSATAVGVYGLNDPAELRDWNDAAPEVAVGMEGAPGHQASTLAPDGSLEPNAARGGYSRSPTLGGFDQMTARLGGFWDSMLGEGRRWWITSTSDSHVHWREGGADFWPGEYSKTYVWAQRTYDGILEGIRGGRVFVTTGDLVSELYVAAQSGGGRADIGETLSVPSGATVEITIRFLDPEGPNSRGDDPAVARVDLISGLVTGVRPDRSGDTNPTTRVVARWTSAEWSDDGPYRSVTYAWEDVTADAYVRVRGTNGAELEPEPDPRGEDPWSDLWFYSNPVFIEVR